MSEAVAGKPWVGWVVVLIVAGFLCPVIFTGISPIDDHVTILHPRMQPPQSPGEAPLFSKDKALWFLNHPDLGLYIPIPYMVWALEVKATYVKTPDDEDLHIDPRVFHAVNLAWHLGNVALVYTLLRRLLRQPNRYWPAAAGALFYGLHPLQVEAFAWISGLKDVMFTTASLGSIVLYLRAIHPNTESSRKRRIADYSIGLLLVPIGMLCKPTAMVAPLIAVLLDWLIYQRSPRRVLLAIAPYLLAAAPLAIAARIVQFWDVVPAPPPWQRPIVAGGSLVFYLWKLLVPLRLCFDYGWRPLWMLQRGWFWAIGLAGLFILGDLLWLTHKRKPWIAAAIAVFICGLLPVLGLTPFSYQFFSTVADHYMVLAMLGPAMLLAWWTARLPRKVTVLIAAWLGILGALSTFQLRYWKTQTAIAQHIVDVNPKSGLGHNSLGLLARERNDLATAEKEFLAGTANPDIVGPPDNLAQAYAADGRPEDALAAFVLYRKTIEHLHLPPEIRPDLRTYLPRVLVPIALALHRPQDARKYMIEQQEVYGPYFPPSLPATRQH